MNGMLLRTDVNGDPLWSLLLGGPDMDVFFDAAEDDNGDQLVVGYTDDGTDAGVIVTRVAPDGTCLWTKRYGSAELSENGVFIQPIGDGTYLIGSERYAHDNDGQAELLTFLIDGDGAVLWATECGAPSIELWPSDCIRSADGSFVVAAQYVLYSVGSYATFLRLAPNGMLAANAVYEDGNAAGLGLVPTPDGKYIMAGRRGNGLVVHASFTKVDPNGSIIWYKVYQSPLGKCLRNTITALPGGGYLAAICWFGNQGQESSTVVQLDEDGNIVRHVGTAPADSGGVVLDQLVQDADGAFTAAGRTGAFVSARDQALTRFSSVEEGLNTLCSDRKDSLASVNVPPLSTIHPFVQTTAPDLIITDLTWTAVPFVTSSLVCTNLAVAERPAVDRTIHIYPDPAESEVTITWAGMDGPFTAEIVNASGAVVQHFSGRGPVTRDVSAYTPGLYLCRIVSASGSVTTAPFMVQ